MARITIASGVGALALVAMACATVPYTGRRQLAIVSADRERELGATAYTEMLRQGRVSTDAATAAVVARVGRRIAAVAERPDWQWEFTLFDDPQQVNAWALPGGKVGVYTGILPVAEDESGLATIVGHEVAHAVAHHGAERAGQGTVLGVVGAGVGIAATVAGLGGSAAMELFGLGTNVGVMLPFSRSQEAEADEIGLILMARAGYDPQAAVTLWERMAAIESAGGASGVASFLSTHPSHGSRVERIRAALPRALAYYSPGADDGTRLLPGVARVTPPAPAERDLEAAMHRLDTLALEARRAEAVAFAIAREADAAPDAVASVLADSELSAGEAALAFAIAHSGGRPIEEVVTTIATSTWQEAARASRLDPGPLAASIARMADRAGRPN
jgi:predicted Zn-dependent protease